MAKCFSVIITIIVISLTQKVSALSQYEVLAGVNNVRQSQGLPALSMNATLNSSAQAKVIDMCQKNYWAHGDWISFIIGSGYSYQEAGENLAEGFRSVDTLVTAWVNSPTHYKNILGNYTEAGIGIITCPSYQNSSNVIIVANHFGRPKQQPVITPSINTNRPVKVNTEITIEPKVETPVPEYHKPKGCDLICLLSKSLEPLDRLAML